LAPSVFGWSAHQVYQAPIRDGVPTLIELGRLLQITERILLDEETTRSQMIFAPGSSLAERGRRPRSLTNMGHLGSQVPKETDRLQH